MESEEEENDFEAAEQGVWKQLGSYIVSLEKDEQAGAESARGMLKDGLRTLNKLALKQTFKFSPFSSRKNRVNIKSKKNDLGSDDEESLSGHVESGASQVGPKEEMINDRRRIKEMGMEEERSSINLHELERKLTEVSETSSDSSASELSFLQLDKLKKLEIQQNPDQDADFVNDESDNEPEFDEELIIDRRKNHNHIVNHNAERDRGNSVQGTELSSVVTPLPNNTEEVDVEQLPVQPFNFLNNNLNQRQPSMMFRSANKMKAMLSNVILPQGTKKEQKKEKKSKSRNKMDHFHLRPNSRAKTAKGKKGSALSVLSSDAENDLVRKKKTLVFRFPKNLGNLKIDRHLVRRLVSQNRKRYVDNIRGYDLDLTYVTPRMIAMAHPSRGLEVLYRNNYSQVIKFFETTHKDHYRIYNLCMKRKYPNNSNVVQFGFCDHNACPMAILLPLIEDIDAWIVANKENVAVVHCKAGKGRTGLVISCYLVHSKRFKTAEDAIRFFGQARTVDGKGMTVASQQRYVEYYQQALHDAKLYNRLKLPLESSPKFILTKMEVHAMPQFMRASMSSLFLRIKAGVANGCSQTGKTRPGEFTLQKNDVVTWTFGTSTSFNSNPNVLIASSSNANLNTQLNNVNTQKKANSVVANLKNRLSLSRATKRYTGATNEGSVQGDFVISCYNENVANVTNKNRKFRKVFQFWLNTNFLQVEANNQLIDAYKIDSKWMDDNKLTWGTMPEAKVILEKLDLDGKVGKDYKNKTFPEDFKVVLTFQLSAQQPLYNS